MHRTVDIWRLFCRSAEVNWTKSKSLRTGCETPHRQQKSRARKLTLLGSKSLLLVFSATILRPLTSARNYATIADRKSKFGRFYYTRFALRRSPSLSALLPPSVTNGEGKCYSELTSFTVDLDMPILSDSAPSVSVLAYAAGNLSMNTKKTLTVTIPGFMDLSEEVIFGECTLNGEGVGNLSCEVRFVPAVEPNLEA